MRLRILITIIIIGFSAANGLEKTCGDFLAIFYICCNAEECFFFLFLQCKNEFKFNSQYMF